MKKLTALLLFGSAIVVTSTLSSRADSQEKSGAKSDLDRLQGNWQMVLREREGELSEIGVIITTVQGTKFRTTDGRGKLLESGTITINEDVTPKTYDAQVTAGFENKDNVYPGVYRLQGDTWQTCVNLDPQGRRPSTFHSRPETTDQMIVWRRLGSLAKEIPTKAEK